MYESRWYHDKGSTAPPRDQYWRRLISPVRPSFDILELRVLPRSMNRSGERPGLGKASRTSKAINFDVLELMVLPHRMACFTTYRSDSKTATLPSRDTILQSQALNHCKGLEFLGIEALATLGGRVRHPTARVSGTRWTDQKQAKH
jgi:hypothetical protein